MRPGRGPVRRARVSPRDAGALVARWLGDPPFRTQVNTAASLMVTALFALYNGYLGAAHGSIWHGGICVYYLLLALLRVDTLLPPQRDAAREKRVFAASWALLLLINVSLIVPFALMVRQQKPVSLTLIPAIAVAAYTTWKVAMAAVELSRRRRRTDRLMGLNETIRFVDALVSVVTLQNTLIMVVDHGDRQNMLTFTAITSGFIWLGIVGLSVYSLIRAVRLRRRARGKGERRI